MSSHLGHGGEFVNIPDMLMKGLSDKEKMIPPSSDRNINSGWTFMGPSTYPYQNLDAQGNGIGRVDRITFHPTNANIFFICTPAGGLWGTLNGGSTWNNLTDHLPAIGISGFVITPSNTSIMYLLTGDGDSNIGGFVEDFGYLNTSIGVLKSTDGGVSWHQTGTFPGVTGDFTGYRLVQSPADPNILLAATSDGLYRTINGGDTWMKELNLTTYDLEFKPGDPTRIYASVFGDIWISTNSGASWTSNSTYDINPNTCGPSNGGRIEIAVAPTSSGKVYFISGPVTGTGKFCGLWLSTDSGASFTRQSTMPNVLGDSDNGNDTYGFSSYDLAIACRSDLSTTIIVGGATLWRSTTSGSTWIHSTSYGEDSLYTYIHPDVHDIAYNPINDYVYAATDGGLFRSTDNGVTWTDLSLNIEASQFYHMRGWDGNINKLMGGLQDNGVKYRMDNSSAFGHIFGADGFDVVFNPDTGEPAFATYNTGVRKFSGDGSSDTWVPTPGYSGYFKPLAIHNTDPDIIFAGDYNIIKSTDGGSNWSDKGASGSWSLTSCPSNSTRFYSAGGTSYQNGSGSLYFSGDTGDTWTARSGNTGFPDPSNWVKITDVTVKPNNSSYVWACFGGFDDGYKVVMSDNTGTSWTNLSFNLPNVPVYCLAIDNNNGAYAGTDIGVFYLGPTVSAWMPWSNGLPNVAVTDLVIFDDGTTKKIRAATFGRGVWQSNLASTCDPAVVVTGNLEGIHHYEAANTLTGGSGFVEGGIGTFVSFQSGNYITLAEGFNVVDDSEFLGFISPCGQGGIPSMQGGGGINRSDPKSSIVSLRRMWDKEDGMPYGSINKIIRNGKQSMVTISLKKSGPIQLYAAMEIQDKLVNLYSGGLTDGLHDINVDLSTLSPDTFYYLLFFYDGKLAHFEEIDMESN
jgi:hypothetical protein